MDIVCCCDRLLTFDSGRVHEFADSQIGHLFSWGETRESARKSMALALKTVHIRGDIHTTTEFLVELMENPDFIESRIDTAWLDKRIAKQVPVRPFPLPIVNGSLFVFSSQPANQHQFDLCWLQLCA